MTGVRRHRENILYDSLGASARRNSGGKQAEKGGRVNDVENNNRGLLGMGDRGEVERVTSRGIGGVADRMDHSQAYITSQFEPTSRASHGLLQLREKGDRRVGLEVCNGAWTGGQAYGLLFEDEGKRKRREWESSSSEEDSEEDGQEDGDMREERERGQKELQGEGEGRARVAQAQPHLAKEVPLARPVPLDNERGQEHQDVGVAAGQGDTTRGKDEAVVEGGGEDVLTKEADRGTDSDTDSDVDDICIEIDDEDCGLISGGVGIFDEGNGVNGEVTLVENGVPRFQKGAVVDEAPETCPHQVSPQSLSLCPLPCSVEATPNLAAPCLDLHLDFDGKEDRPKAGTCAEVGLSIQASTINDQVALAIMGGERVERIKKMLATAANGGEIDWKANNTLPPALVCACQQNSEVNTAIVAALLEYKAELNEPYKGDGFTPLIQSAKTGNVDMVGLLLEAGAEVDFVCKDGRSALFVAIDGHKTDIACRLLMYCKHVDALRVDPGRTALMEAARRGQADVVRALLERGADVDLVDSRGRTALMLSLEEGVSDKSILRPLMSKTSVNLADENGVPPLEVALSKKLGSASQLLVDAQCELGEYQRKISADGEAQTCVPLILAIIHQAGTLLIRKMLERGAPAECAVDGKTALMHAAELGQSQTVTDLIKAGADPLKEHGNRMTALMYSARLGHKNASQVLMSAMGIGPTSGK